MQRRASSSYCFSGIGFFRVVIVFTVVLGTTIVMNRTIIVSQIIIPMICVECECVCLIVVPR